MTNQPASNQFLSRIRIVLAVIIPVIVIFVLLNKANAIEYRYGLRYGPCLHKMFTNASHDIDVLGMGGSRMMALLKPEEVQQHYKTTFNKDITVYNFGKDWQGPDYDYQLLKDFIESGDRQVKTLLLILDKQRNDDYHPLAYSVFENSTLLDSMSGVRPEETVLHFSHILRAYLARIRDVVFNNKQHDKKYIERLSVDGQTCYPRDFKIEKSRLKRSKRLYKKRGIGRTSVDFLSADNSLAHYYYKKIIDYAKQHDIEVKLIRATALHQPRLNNRSKKDIEQLFGAPVLRIPLKIRHKLYDKGYRDGKHLLKPGRDLVLPWLVKQF